jgi:hypothetical protein
MKKLILVGMFLFSNLALAATVVRVLPADATNIRVTSSVVDYVGVGSKVVSDSASDGPVTETIFAKRLVVTVKYNSKDISDVNQTIFEDGQQPDRTPTVTYFFKLAPAKLAAVRSGKLAAGSLVTKSVATANVTLDDPNYQYKCQYDNEYNTKVDPKCQETPNKVTQVRPVLKLDVAND